MSLVAQPLPLRLYSVGDLVYFQYTTDEWWLCKVAKVDGCGLEVVFMDNEKK